ncbi:helix-hairpin-helix domain-containing protein [Terracoccus luteus]|uniref:Competence protein ComEA n=1 Tax=Terracoccus luteus TaxID=53356 RepID=A0A839PRZ1_9MICO|nr:helix-hairpin-helix domain-containing protein [Terracoccus luteus]MBB2987048.1 competence protein ComEA [Terracoccus luteus]MCP2172699.1 competence protein ComEA [Terracoccus luteus]
MPRRPQPRARGRAPDLERVLRLLDTGPPSGGAPGAMPEGRGEAGFLPSRPPSDAGGPAAFDSVVSDGARDGRDDVGDAVERLDADLRRARRPAVLSLPEPLVRGRRGVSSAAVVAVLALLVAVTGIFLVRVLWAERAARAETGSVVVGEPGAGGPLPDASSDASSGASAGPSTLVVRSAPVAASVPAGGGTGGTVGADGAAPASEVVVHVVGQVARPGLVRLPAGSRVADALVAAGGATRAADLTSLNLARVVGDGEQLHVLRPGETPPPVVAGGGLGAGGTAGGGSAAGGAGPSGGAPAVVDLNGADLGALDSLPGVGPVLAQRILDWRAEHGRFSSVDELGEVSGIGDKLMAQLRPRVRV